MTTFTFIVGAVLVISILLDVFETIVLPRRVTRRLRATPYFYRYTWRPYSWVARRIKSSKRREGFLGIYGPASLLLLLAVWAAAVVVGFALLQYSAGSALQTASGPPSFRTDLYYSATTMFTLGLGDISPTSTSARFLTVVEAGLGFGLLALVIGYFPVLYQSFSRREINVSLLDGRAGTPPTVAELLRRFHGRMDLLASEILKEWEVWAAELLESHLSYPVLAYFRSQHDNQSWLACLTAILDVSALLTASLRDPSVRQPLLTFAMARHAVVDLANVFNTPPSPPARDRLTHEEFLQLRPALANAGLAADTEAEERITDLRKLYEAYVNALSRHLLLALPPWIPAGRPIDNWLTTAWGRTTSPLAVSQPFDAIPDEKD